MILAGDISTTGSTCLGRSSVSKEAEFLASKLALDSPGDCRVGGRCQWRERGAQDVTHLHSVHRRVNVVRGGANHEWQLMCQLLFMTGLTNSALFAGFRPMLTSEPEAVPTPAYRTVLYSTVQ